MPKLTGAVGAGGANGRDDVRVVQQMLNGHLGRIAPLPKLAEDGIVGPKTLKAIEAFQLKALRLPHPDRRVDIDGPTFQALAASVSPARVQRPSFAALKRNYRTRAIDIHSCSMHFPNTCAIRMSEALVRTDPGFLGVFQSSNVNVCPHGFVRGAQDLGAVLGRCIGARDLGFAARATGEAPAAVQGRSGIVCYMTIPTFAGTGHIDLWERDGPVGQDYWNAQTIWMWTLP